jgi:hypothetical protein
MNKVNDFCIKIPYLWTPYDSNLCVFHSTEKLIARSWGENQLQVYRQVQTNAYTMLARGPNMNFWLVHGWIFLVCMFFFPRLTLFFSSVASGGFLWWLGFLFAPRLLVAILATSAYWTTNMILVIFTWFWALGGETIEKAIVF